MIIINKLMLQNCLKILSNNNKTKHKNKNNRKYKSSKKNSHNNQILFNINSSKLFKVNNNICIDLGVTFKNDNYIPYYKSIALNL